MNEGKRYSASTLVVTVVAVTLWLVMSQVAWADIPPPPIKRLTDPNRAKVLAALAGLVILGFGMVLLTWLGARITQRYRHSTPYFRPTPRPGEHEWTKKPLAEENDE